MKNNKYALRKYSSHKQCFVPMCDNSTRSTPGKQFFLVPENFDLREKWFKNVQRKICDKTVYSCDDHFDIETDYENYYDFKIFRCKELILKKNVVPHILTCQENFRKQNTKRSLSPSLPKKIKITESMCVKNLEQNNQIELVERNKKVFLDSDSDISLGSISSVSSVSSLSTNLDLSSCSDSCSSDSDIK